ncbi:MAG: glycerol-3-phosphate dehydrogenase/oxidase [Rhabdochlamydiaceae bacterium]|nr:glycerol-3-phosphate dehydrogenase/oxidase [Candidatus Amphrikana amoebophyrae]
MNRTKMIKKMNEIPRFDVVIIGGGATGLGAAVDSAARGLKTLLVERDDFAKATSSRSTKLIHGGLRYLQQGNLSLVTEALKERGRLCKNAPHLISHRPFLVPNYHWWEGPFYGFGLKVYDALAGKQGIEKSYHLSKEETLKAIPNLKKDDLRGGVIYYDGQFDDSRLAITLAKTCIDLGGIALNYMCAESFIKENGQIIGIVAKDSESGNSYKIKAKSVINACGIFSDEMRQKDNPKVKPRLVLSQGVHLVLKGELLSSNHAILVPHTDDGRVLFLVPWHNRVLAGTTDSSVEKATSEPIAKKDEVDFIMRESQKFLAAPLQKSDVLSVFAGIRPLAKKDDSEETKKLSRDHVILVSNSNLISIFGGKWTTYRKMGEDVINKAIEVANLTKKECATYTLKLHGYAQGLDPDQDLSTYGSNYLLLRKIANEDPSYNELIHPNLPYQKSEVIYAVRYEMARKLEDVLCRRTRSILLDAAASVESCATVAKLMAKELGYGQDWSEQQIANFKELSATYLPSNYL